MIKNEFKKSINRKKTIKYILLSLSLTIIVFTGLSSNVMAASWGYPTSVKIYKGWDGDGFTIDSFRAPYDDDYLEISGLCGGITYEINFKIYFPQLDNSIWNPNRIRIYYQFHGYGTLDIILTGKFEGADTTVVYTVWWTSYGLYSFKFPDEMILESVQFKNLEYWYPGEVLIDYLIVSY